MMRVALFSFVLVLMLTGCASTPPVAISGNGNCHPAADLPAHKVMKKVPEQATLLEDLWGLFASERKDHAADIRDYNSLYDTCVGKGTK